MIHPSNSLISAKRPTNLVQTIERMDQLLTILSKFPRGIQLGDLAAKVGLPKGTTHRLVSSLAYFDYIQQDLNSRKYKLGFKLVTLGEQVLDQIDLRSIAHPHLLELSQQSMEIAHLVVMDNDEALYVDKIQPVREGLHMSSRIGYRAPLHCTAVGKALLACQSRDEFDRIIQAKGLPRRTANTITDVARLKYHLEKVKKNGYALDNEEHSQGVRCVAAPIHNKKGMVFAAVSVSAPAVRISLNLARGRIKTLVASTAQMISNQLGYNFKKKEDDSCQPQSNRF
jgi:DNA-binding IclR family transcriptional regulator